MQKIRSLKKRLNTKSYDGFMLPISEATWSRIDKKARNLIRKAERSKVEVSGTSLQGCCDCTHNNRFEAGKYDFRLGDHKAFHACLNGQEVGRVLVDFAEPLIIYRCACSTGTGKKVNANSLLLWSLVEKFSNSSYRYLVLGYSSIPSIEHFKEQFGVLRFLVPARFWSFLPSHHEEVRAYVIFEKRTTNHP